jgi:hypothetical protein
MRAAFAEACLTAIRAPFDDGKFHISSTLLLVQMALTYYFLGLLLNFCSYKIIEDSMLARGLQRKSNQCPQPL